MTYIGYIYFSDHVQYCSTVMYLFKWSFNTTHIYGIYSDIVSILQQYRKFKRN